MSKAKRIKIIVLALLAALTAAFLPPSRPAAATAANGAFKDITLQPGSDGSMMNFCWHSVSADACAVQIAPDGDGAVFPAVYSTFKGTVAAATKGWFTNTVTVCGLAPDTGYVYRVTNGTSYGDTGRFKTGGADYNALFVSDAQIGASGSVTADKAAWENTLSVMLGRFPGTSFILSAGDQVDYYLESEYDAFLASPLLRRYPLAAAAGNHESLGKSPLHSMYYNEPNESATAGVTPAGGDYWFRHGNTLYIVLNTNSTDTAQHDAFIGRAIGAFPGRTWTVLMFHHSLYSSAAHSTASAIVSLRDSLVPVIDKYGIDVVLSGHDHCYTRTYPMHGGQPGKTGTVYVTAGSASGSKYYPLKKTPEAYAAVRLQPDAPTLTDISVRGGTLTLTTYRADTMAVLDTFALVKETASGFDDVPAAAWYAPAVAWLAQRGITSGTSPRLFSPEMTLTRGQCLVFLMKTYGLPPDTAGGDNFADAGNTWYTGYLAAAKRLGLAGGAGGNRFLPDELISRQDMATLVYNTLVRLDRLPSGGGVPPLAYIDGVMVASYAQNAVNALSAAGVLSGSGGSFNPSGRSTRAQMAQVLYNLSA